ncbi:MAG: nucleotide exchange factor GrpE [Muribaculaceae bacterium]
MSKKNKNNKKIMSKNKEAKKQAPIDDIGHNDVEEKAIGIDEAELQDAEIETPIDENAQQQAKIDELEVALAKEKEEYMFLMAEFDNFRKRTIKEKGEIIRNGAEKAMNELLPIIDDFERGIQASAETEDVSSVKEGIELIYNKFVKYLEKNGVKAIDTEGKDFDTELHEAVTTFPAPDDSLKGKIIDTVQKGYTLNDKVLRHSKVVVGQ